jgi:WD40 repeat protein
MIFRRLVIFSLVLAWASVGRAAEDTPVLTLNTGGHMAIVKGIAFTPDGKQLISVSHDKAIRVWDWRADQTVRTIRGQSSLGEEGMIYAMALSSDGQWLAVGGFFAPMGTGDQRVGAIRLYEFATGQMTQLLKGHGNTVSGLAFSPDGKRLVSGSSDNSAIIWDVKTGLILHRLSGHKYRVNDVAFSSDGTLVATASDDETLKLWRADGRLLSTLKGHTGNVKAVAFSPTDQSMVSTGWDYTVKFWDRKTRRLKRSIDLECGWGLTYTPNGRFVVCNNGYVIDTRTYKKTIKNEPSTGMTAAISPDGRLAATTNQEKDSILIWEIETGRSLAELDGTGRDIWALGFSEDGCDLAWGHLPKPQGKLNDRGDVALEISLPCAGKTISAPRPISRPVSAYTKPVTKYGDIELELASSLQGPAAAANMNLLHVKQGSTNIATLNAQDRGFRHQVYTFTPDGKTVLSGGANGQLHAYEIESSKVARFVGHTGYVWALAVSPDGRLAASGAADKTINIWNAKTGELIVTLFHGDDGEWVMWTPQGYYISSPDGDKIVGWQINKGPDQAADYVNANQLRTHFYRPDIVERAIILASATAAVAQASGTVFSLPDLLKRRPPAFDIISPEDGGHASATPIEFRLKLEPNADAIETIEVLVNGRQTTTPTLRNATARLATLGVPERRIEVPLEQGENKIRIVARNQVGQTVRDFVLFHDKPGLLDARGTLYVLAIGVNKYPYLPPICGDGKQNCDLRYAGADARAFRDVLVKQVGPLHKDTKTMLLAPGGDKPPTRANIEDALGEILGKAGPEDTTVLFIAGHGVNDGPSRDYLFLPEDAQPTNNGWRKSTVMPWILIQNALHNTQGRRLMFADTCHSGGAYNARLVNDAANANIVVFSATDTQTLSWEFEHLAHGAFTYALIHGLEGKARRRDGSVTLLGLGEYISEEVASLTKDKQQPTFHMSGAKNFSLVKQ